MKKGFFDDSDVIWFQFLRAALSEAVARFLVPFFKHVSFLLSKNCSNVIQRFTIHNLRLLYYSVQAVPILRQLFFFGGISISCSDERDLICKGHIYRFAKVTSTDLTRCSLLRLMIWLMIWHIMWHDSDIQITL